MRNAALYLWCKKIHRIFVVLIFILGVIMSSSGYMMHENVYFLLPASQIRTLHNTFSTLFAIILGIMSLTGLYLYVFPFFPVKKPDPPKPSVN